MGTPTEIMRPTDTVGWKSGFDTIKRVTLLALKSPWMVAISLVSTVIATALQLMVPILLGRAVDQTQALVSEPTTPETATVPIVDSLKGIAMAVAVVIGGSMVLDQQLEVGVMVAFLFYIQRFFDPIRSLTIQYSVMQRAMASGQRLMDVLDVAVDIKDAPDAVDLPCNMYGSVEFKDVTFGYNPANPVLKSVNFRVNPGETVALVGPTGSGKSSAMSLLNRFYDLQGGRVLVSGHDVRDVTQSSIGREIAMVLQEPYLFSGTVLENIRYNKDSATKHDVISAAKAVGAHDFIMALPLGYETVMGERGGTLSLGQR